MTRDAVPQFEDFGLEMVGYVARQSLISAFSKADITKFDLRKISSSFQRRMAKGDIEGNLRFAIRKAEPDVIFWDLCDERLRVAKPGGQGFVTLAHDYVGKGSHPGPFSGRLSVGQDQHFELWKRGLEQFFEVLEKADLRSSLYLNATPWAIQDEFGNDHNGQRATAEQFNQLIERYIDYARASSVEVVTIPQDQAVSRTKGHQWGPAPFHYTHDTYTRMLEALTAAMQEQESEDVAT